MYDLKIKAWLVRDGEFIISDGRAMLLGLIKETKSLSKAAKKMDMSYRHAWGILQRVSKNAGGDVVVSARGGREGGETELTALGEEILREFKNKAEALTNQLENHWKKPSVTADGIVTKNDKVLLIRRKNDPFKGSLALPGGFLNYGEKLEDCVVREVREETGIKTEIVGLVGVYSGPERDPRGHFVTAVYHLSPVDGRLRPGDDAATAEWVSMDKLPGMSFDHRDIVSDFLRGMKRTKKKP